MIMVWIDIKVWIYRNAVDKKEICFDFCRNECASLCIGMCGSNYTSDSNNGLSTIFSLLLSSVVVCYSLHQ